jgi:NAD+ synthase
MKELTDKLVAWIKERVSEANCCGTVFGMSGGLDSSVVAILCKQAFPENSLGLILPCHSNGEDMEHAYLLANKFNIQTKMINLDAIYDNIVGSLPVEAIDFDMRKLAKANLKPRLRMIVLYYMANQLGYLVVGSSNRSELTVGYFSKYGDGGADILLLGNLVKSQVRELACHLGVPTEIINKPPSAGLWEGQTDEQEMGITYEQIEEYLTSGDVEQEIKEHIERKVGTSAHKRIMPPIPPF